MICPICGSEIADSAVICVKCGAQIPNSVKNPKVPGYGLGIVSLVLGILSILLSCCLPAFNLILSIAGLIFGFLSMRDAKKAESKNNIALAGLICSGVGTAIGLVCLAIFGFEILYALMYSL